MLVVRCAVGLAQFGQQAGEFALLPGQRLGQFVGQRSAQGSQRGGERGVGQAVRSDLHATADGHDGLAAAGRREELLDQARLADTRFAADEQSLRLSGGGAGERVGERGELAALPTKTGLTVLVSTSPSIAYACDSLATDLRPPPIARTPAVHRHAARTNQLRFFPTRPSASWR